MNDYQYVKGDLLLTPQKYQMSPFFGKSFLVEYIKSRKNFLKFLNIPENKSQNDIFKIIFQNFDKEKGYEKSDLVTKDLLTLILFDVLHGQNFDEVKPKLNELVRKFEIKKRIYESYNNKFQETSNNFNDLRNYLLLSVICLKWYETTNNLKFLNSSLKINDVLCSKINDLNNELDNELLNLVLKKELGIILEQSKKKGVLLND